MKKRIFTSLVFTLIIFSAITSTAQTAAKSVYAELGGPGLASINYDMRFQKKEDGLGFRIGIGGYNVDDESALFIPVGLTYLIGKDQKNYFEVGGGITFVSVKDSYGSFDEDNFNSTFGHLYFGYRLQPKNGGFIFRAGITPVFNSYGFIPYYAGISFGYKF